MSNLDKINKPVHSLETNNSRALKWGIFLLILSVIVFVILFRSCSPVVQTISAPAISELPGIVDSPIVSLKGTGTPGSTVEILVNNKKAGTTDVNESGSWSLKTEKLEPGDYTLLAIAVDETGERHGKSGEHRFTVKGPDRDLTITLPATDDLKPGARTFTGTGSPGSTVEVTLNDKQTGTAVVAGNGTWNLKTTELEPGEYTFTAHVLDAAGNRQKSSKSQTFTISSSLKAPTLELPGTLGSGEVLDPAAIAITGTGTLGTSVELFRNGLSVGKTEVDSAGRWQLTTAVDSYLSEFQVVGISSDASEIVKSEVVQLAVPAAAAQISANGAPTFGSFVTADNGASSAKLTWAGSGEPNANVRILAGDQEIGTTTVGTDGKWSLEQDVTLMPGAYDVKISMGSSDGRELNASAPISVTVPRLQAAGSKVAAESVTKPEAVSDGVQNSADKVNAAKSSLTAEKIAPVDAPVTPKSLVAAADPVKLGQVIEKKLEQAVAVVKDTADKIAPVAVTVSQKVSGDSATSVTSTQVAESKPGKEAATLVEGTVKAAEQATAGKEKESSPAAEYEKPVVEPVAVGKAVKDQAAVEVGKAKASAGSPGEQLQKELNRILALNKVEFEVNKDVITPNGKRVLDTIVGKLNEFSAVKVEIGGHTDSDGSAEWNRILSDKRAKAVQSYLVAKKIAAARLTEVGYGESKPLVENSSRENKQKNRRVELRVVK